jgi:predicted HNH restriction endonuclease
MNAWRMSMKVGNQGDNLWPTFHEMGIAVITYYPMTSVDLRNYSRSNYPNEWRNLKPSQKSSLSSFAYDVKRGDIIYVKDGPTLVSKGTVIGEYYYDGSRDVVDRYDMIWPHRIIVNWDDNFPTINIKLGAEPTTLLQLDAQRLAIINRLLGAQNISEVTNESEEQKIYRDKLFEEGRIFKEEQYFRKRNRDLILEKKNLSEHICEVCGFNFAAVYGERGNGFIEAHHLVPISRGERVNTIHDIALVCSNCHSMIHRTNPPISVDELKELMERTAV